MSIMETTVIICSVGRPAILHETVLGLMKQTVQPASIILSLCAENSALSETRRLPLVRCILGPKGLATQRNTAIPFARSPYALFLDDDVELAPDYIEQMERLFAADPAIVAASGGVAADGAPDGTGIEREAADKAIREYRGSRDCVPFKGVYGCNMFVRSDVLQLEKFDERLPLYAWLEDLDFSLRCRRHGKIVRHRSALMAHLGTRSGRTSDLRYGYAKVANPWYLWRKSVLNSLPEVVVRYWAKTTLANLLRALVPKGPQQVNYRKRLMGNLMAYRDLALRRIDPLNILKIPDSVEVTRPRG
jgi:GT2 family glycosyltransferase